MAMKTKSNPIRTLIVDDSHDECMLLNAELCSENSIKVMGFVHDGIEAIAYLRGIEQFQDREMFPYPDLVLLDFCMPRCSGMGVLRFLQGQFHRPRVVLWSTTLERVSLPLAFRLGADMVCRKPTRKQELMEIISRIQARIFRQSPVLLPETRIAAPGTSILPGQPIASALVR
jgi:CheY-like chemotaxis protein